MTSWIARTFFRRPAADETPGYDLLADPVLARLTPRELADLPLWPAPEPPAAVSGSRPGRRDRTAA